MARDGRAPSTRAASPTGSESNGLGREHVSEIQRTRVLTAMAEVAGELGAADVSVAHVVEHAGVSRRTFYGLFGDREACFLAAFERAIVVAEAYVSARYDSTADWAKRIRAGLEALLGFVEQEPALARLAVVESLGAGAKALELRRGAFDRLVAAVDAGHSEMNGNSTATALTAEGVVGGAASVIHGRLVSGESRRITELVNPLMSMIVLPYLGSAAARKELDRSLVEPPVRVHAPAPGNPLKDLDMRLTYRTVRVLAAVATSPGSSNRVIGDAAGIGDQGQVSKLLTRLERLGLIANTRVRSPKRTTNSWTLSERGREVADVIATQSTAA
jgi:AcrR family transcriptional regulator/DNA-binding MarR family transcriptional regulator